MRAYRVTANTKHAETGELMPTHKFAGTQAEASKMRREMAERHGLRPLADVSFEEVEVPTDKQGLIAFLNAELGG